MLNNFREILFLALLVISTRLGAASIYYDANGERIYKLTGTSNIGQVNSGPTKAQAIFDDAVLYPNPYMVVTQKGYTKHYYAGTERLATVIGGGLMDNINTQGPVVERMNIIRQELGPYWGQRMSYMAFPSHGQFYIPFNGDALWALGTGLIPSSIFGQQSIRLKK